MNRRDLTDRELRLLTETNAHWDGLYVVSFESGLFVARWHDGGVPVVAEDIDELRFLLGSDYAEKQEGGK